MIYHPDLNLVGEKTLNNSDFFFLLESAPTNILDLRPVAPAFIHHKARATPYPQCAEKRFPVPDDKVPWEVRDHFFPAL